MMKRVLILASVTGFVVLLGSWPGVGVDRASGAALSAAGSPAPQAGQAMQMGTPMQDMMKMHEKMMTEMKATQAKLDEIAKAMNSATGQAKVSPMAELLNELVRSHRMMGDHMATMHQHMMKMGK
jgi:hypothetical protein